MNVTCVIDDAVQRSSPFWGEHGLAFLIETEAGRLLFDTGQSGTVLLHNLELLGVAPTTIDALAISHAHYDHTGGLPALLECVRPGIPLYANPDLFRERFSRREGEPRSMGLALTREELAAQLTLRLSSAPQEILSGVWTTGEITQRPEPEGWSDYHLVREGGAFVADSYQDDMALVLEIDGRLVLLCGCCHAGLLNTLTHVRRVFGRDPATVIGGTHLISADEAHLRRLVDVLQRLGPPALYLNHCTGQTAYVVLAQAFGERVSPCPAGTVLEF